MLCCMPPVRHSAAGICRRDIAVEWARRTLVSAKGCGGGGELGADWVAQTHRPQRHRRAPPARVCPLTSPPTSLPANVIARPPRHSARRPPNSCWTFGRTPGIRRCAVRPPRSQPRSPGRRRARPSARRFRARACFAAHGVSLVLRRPLAWSPAHFDKGVAPARDEVLAHPAAARRCDTGFANPA